MRANVNLDTEAYDFAYAYAKGRGIPLGAAISELLLRAQDAPPRALNSPRVYRDDKGWLVFSRPDGKVITPEMVKAFLEDDLDQ